MSYGTFAYEKADPGNLNAYLGDKIMSAAKMAAEERKFRDQEIKTLSAKPNRTKEEEEKLQELLGEKSSRKKGKFFGKALAHEFGGDLLRRTKGTFSKDPSETEDPALTKRQRFSALIRGEQLVKPAEQAIKPEPFKQLELFTPTTDKNSVQVKDDGLKNVLDKAFSSVSNSYDALANKLKSISTTEEKTADADDKVTSVVEKIVSGFDEIKSFFNKNNDIKKQEIRIEQQELDLKLDQKEDAEMASGESSIESAEDMTSTADYSFGEPAQQKAERSRGILGKLFDLPFGRRRGRGIGRLLRRKGSRLKGLGGPKKLISKVRFGRGGGGGSRGVKPVDTQYSNPVGPLPMGSKEPWVRSPEGMPGISGYSPFMESIPKLSEGGVVMPKAESKAPSPTKVDKKLAEGGIVDNPTVTTLGQDKPTAVIPLNRNSGKSLLGNNNVAQKQNDKNVIEPLSKALQLPTQAAGGLLLSVFSSALNNLGGISNLFKPFFNVIMSPLARVFGLPANIINTMMGGSAQAATFDPAKLAEFLKGDKDKKKKTSGTSGGGGAPPGGGGGGSFGAAMTASGGSTASQFITSKFGKRTSPKAGASSDHGGIDIAGGAWKEGAPISVIKPGTVEEVGNLGSSGWGKYVVIKHDDGSYTLYGHLSEINVKKGDKIQNVAGQATVIGKVGNTGVSTGAHLHFELGRGWNGTIKDKIDPAPYVDNYVRAGGNVTVAPISPTGQAPSPVSKIAPGQTAPSPQKGKPTQKPTAVNLTATPQPTFTGLTTPSYLNATSSPFSIANPQAPIYGNSNW